MTAHPQEEPPWPDEPTPLASKKRGPKVEESWTVRQLAELPSAEEEYIISQGILTKGGKLLLYAGPGAGKTTLLDFLAAALATGKPFLGKYPVDRPRQTLVVQGELSRGEMSSHAQTLVSTGYADDRLRFARMTDLKLPTGESRLRDLIAEHKAEIVALDPWYRLFEGESSDKAEQVGCLFDVCDRLLDTDLVQAVIVVHHANVSGFRTAGSWVFQGWPSSVLRLEKVQGIRDQRILEFEKLRAPDSDLNGDRIRLKLGEEGYLLLDKAWEPPAPGCAIARDIVEQAGGQLPRKELMERLMARYDCKERWAAKYLGEAVQARLLESVRMGMEVFYRVIEEPQW